MPKLTKFSVSILANDPSADEGFFIDEHGTQDPIMHAFYYGAQKVDMLDAYVYATENLVAEQVDLKTMTPETLVAEIKALAKIAAKSITDFDGRGLGPGDYQDNLASILKDTGVKGISFDRQSEFSEVNYETLKRLFGKEEADNYKSFCKLITEKTREDLQEHLKDCKTPEERKFKMGSYSYNPARVIFKFKLQSEQGYKTYRRIFDFGVLPEKIHHNMLKMAKFALDKIKEDKPFLAATYIIREIARIHPFINGNGRVARIIANCILMQGGHPAINFGEFGREQGYSFIVQKMLEKETSKEYFKLMMNTLKALSNAGVSTTDNISRTPLSLQACETIGFACENSQKPLRVYFRLNNKHYIVKQKDVDKFYNIMDDWLKYRDKDLEKFSASEKEFEKLSEAVITPEYLLAKAMLGDTAHHKYQRFYMAKAAIDMLEKAPNPDCHQLTTAILDAANYALECNNRKVFNEYLTKAQLIIDKHELTALQLRAIALNLKSVCFNPLIGMKTYCQDVIKNILASDGKDPILTGFNHKQDEKATESNEVATTCPQLKAATKPAHPTH